MHSRCCVFRIDKHSRIRLHLNHNTIISLSNIFQYKKQYDFNLRRDDNEYHFSCMHYFCYKSFLQSRYFMLQIRNVDMETQFQTSEILNILKLLVYIPIYYCSTDKDCNRYAKKLTSIARFKPIKIALE